LHQWRGSHIQANHCLNRELNMVLFVLAYLRGVLPIVSPCILPVLP
jgi:cytochrome c biogenesis protein CcdA